jgi:hypothetical protein
MTNGFSADSVQAVHFLGHTFSYESIGRWVAGAIFVLIVGIPTALRYYRTTFVPGWKFLRSMREFIRKIRSAFNGAARLAEIIPAFEDCIQRVIRIESSVAMHEAVRRAEWNATAESRIKFDENCRLVYANSASLAIMRLDSSEATGMGWQNAVTEMRRDEVIRQMERAARFKSDAEIVFPIDTPGSTSDAAHLTLHLSVIPNGTPAGFGGWIGWFSYRDGVECKLAPVCPLGLKRPVAITAAA